MESEQIVFQKGEIHSIDPRTKMLLLAFIACLTMSGDIVGFKIYFRLLLGLLPAVLLAADKNWSKSICYALAFFLGWVVESFFMLKFTGSLGLLLLIVSGLITRFSPSLMMGYYFISTTQVDQLITALHNWHIPNFITIPVAVIFRFIPTIKEESDSIKNAMQIRNINSKLALKKPIKYIEYRFVPLMSSIIRIGEDLSAAALTRGLGGAAKRSSIYDVKFRVIDLIAITATLLIVLGYLYL